VQVSPQQIWPDSQHCPEQQVTSPQHSPLQHAPAAQQTGPQQDWPASQHSPPQQFPSAQHTEPQQLCAAAQQPKFPLASKHGSVQTPPQHTCGAGQAVAQVPQCDESVWRSTHTPSQQSSPVAQHALLAAQNTREDGQQSSSP
jgi:hypothetical protein